jgi:hypothetical protein
MSTVEVKHSWLSTIQILRYLGNILTGQVFVTQKPAGKILKFKMKIIFADAIQSEQRKSDMKSLIVNFIVRDIF